MYICAVVVELSRVRLIATTWLEVAFIECHTLNEATRLKNARQPVFGHLTECIALYRAALYVRDIKIAYTPRHIH